MMKIYKAFFIGLLMCLFLTNAMGQGEQNKITISGKVLSPYGKEPVAGAVISVEGEDETTLTGIDGEFTIEVNSELSVLSIWADGFHETFYPVLNRKEVTIPVVPVEKFNYTLKLENENADNRHRSSFKKGAVYVEDVLQNAFPGLNVINKSGMPGEGAYINLRGIRTLSGDNAPLMVINGVPYLPDMANSAVIGGYSQSIFNGINVNNIESIRLIKGAEASMYGSMGSNGVLLIETTKATDMETVIEYSGQFGVATNTARIPVMGVNDFKSYIGDVGLTQFEDMGQMLQTFPFLRDDPNYYYNFLYNNDTDWQSLVYKPAFVSDNNLRVKGGDAIAKYDLSVGILDQNGPLINTNLTRYSTRLNANIVLSKKVELFSSIGVSYLKSKLHEQGMLNSTNPVLAAMQQAPILSPYKKDEFNNELPAYDVVRQFNTSNPLALVNTVNMSNDYYEFFLNSGINYQLNDHFKLTGIFGMFANYTRQAAFVPGRTSESIVPLENGVALNTARSGIGQTSNHFFNLSGNYNKTFGFHTVSAGIGYQGLLTKEEFDAGSGRNTSSDFYQTLSYVENAGREFMGYINLWNWMSMYGYANYDYKNLVTVSFNASADGTSASGADTNRFGFFPGTSVTWKLSNMSGLNQVYLLNTLNLRAGYSVTGNSRFSSNLSQPHYVSQIYRQLSGIARGNVANTNLRWETNYTTDLGLDISILNHRIQASVDLYQTVSKDVILPRKISPVFGIDQMYANIGEISNKGIELGIQAGIIEKRNFGFTMGATINRNINILKSLGGEDEMVIEMGDGSAIISKVGHSPYNFYGFVTEGVFASQAEADEANLKDHNGNQFNAGDIKFQDVDGNGVINNHDRQLLGSAFPDFFGGVYANMRYKRFSLAAYSNFSYGNMAYNATRRQMESMSNFYNQTPAVNRRWQMDGHQTDMPKPNYGDPMQNNRFSERWIEDASFFRLTNVTLSYQFNVVNRRMFKGATVYVTGENLFTATNYLGLDPVHSFSYQPYMQGFDYGKVALPRTFKVGFNLQF